MILTITNLTSNNLSTEIGLIKPTSSLSQVVPPDQAYRMALDIQTLVTAGKASFTIASDPARSDALEGIPINSSSFVTGAIPTAALAAGAVTKAKMLVFVSAETSGTGSSQNVAHGLGVVPAAVFVMPTDLTPATVGSYVVTEGAHDATNVKVTVTTSKKFKVVAFG